MPRPIPRNFLESDLGYTSRIYFDNVTLTLHNLTLTRNHANTISSVIAAKQTVINEVYVYSIIYRYSDILLNNHNFIYSVDKSFWVIKIMDFDRTGPRCYMNNTIFWLIKWSFFVHSTA